MIRLFKIKDQKKEDAANANGRAPGKKQSAGELRLHKDISELNLPKTTTISFPNGKDDLMNFEISIKPDEGYYLGGTFVFTFQVSTSYPHEPPKVKCKTKVYHPNIDLEGNVCLNILREDWKPVLNINTVIYGLNHLFTKLQCSPIHHLIWRALLEAVTAPMWVSEIRIPTLAHSSISYYRLHDSSLRLSVLKLDDTSFGLEYAEHRNTHAALRCAKEFIDAMGGSVLKALDETAKWEQGELLRIKAKLKVAQSLPMDAVEAYRLLLALVQARRKSFGSQRSSSQVEDDKLREFEVWEGLANLYSSLSYWKDADICLEKAKALKPYSASTLHTEGLIHEARGEVHEALASYGNSLSMELDFVPCKVSIGSLLLKMGSKSLPVGRSFLSDALRIEPTNRMAWYYLGMIHKNDGRLADAADCFQAASMLEESEPVESFSSIS